LETVESCTQNGFELAENWLNGSCVKPVLVDSGKLTKEVSSFFMDGSTLNINPQSMLNLNEIAKDLILVFEPGY
jgi:hypothetical protein